ncbi:PREDICTED: GATA transcription factor 16-like [Nicotiana attenuata]|uniref:Gata transcription factor 16 n=1 Tax=Nicotiana attenuata TaxID=49451 RepID=A0A1J6J5I5_NICAT|nr:PREDICTED: GATA transcription factor 16-like [Nicotiana attenuata]OIT07928.1 gata transcription factor 16 [Nicotiana attenuata]
MDLKEVKGSEVEEMKTCSDCHTTRTPLWRSGPAGPKSLCNACGIKYNKKRRQLLGLDKGRSDKGKKKRKISGEKNGQSLKMKLMALGGKLREEEQAAVLLMALSCGSVYA